ncbi:hypothetical protein [Brevibacterium luteolum]|uniref:hypothetical protein n=1 Tax=Brevibacterium luteolum TaxID=199591 RepID=UPI001C246F52|nr:hypothetical protein [Brevibacterium luteolum]MBU8579135.1 hypothetical protein [Brevibacterium luteolum]
MTVASVRRVAAAAVTAGLGLVLLSSTGVTLAKWYDNTALSDTQITTGSFMLEAGSTAPVQLHSRFSADQRSFTGGTECTAPDGFAACCELTAAELKSQLLLPGDQLLLQETFRAGANGTNLVAEIQVDRNDATEVLPSGSIVKTDLLKDGEPVADPAEVPGTGEVSEWTARATITTPDQWPMSFEARDLELGSLTVSITQREP